MITFEKSGARNLRCGINDNWEVCECPECLKDISARTGGSSGDAKKKCRIGFYHRSTQFFSGHDSPGCEIAPPGKRFSSYAYFSPRPPLIRRDK